MFFEILYKNRYLYWFVSTVPFTGQWRISQRLVLPRLYGHDVLELGCGLGDLLVDMIEAGYNCQAIEKSPEMVDAARLNLHKHRLGDPTWISQGQAQGCVAKTGAAGGKVGDCVRLLLSPCSN